MTKINNRAFTVVELIITFSIVMVISVGLFKVLDSYREKQQQESYRKMINNYKNEITKTIKDDILKLGIKEIKGITTSAEDEPCYGYDQGINIKFNDNSNKDLCVGAEGEDYGIKYGDIFYKVPSKFIKFKDDFLFDKSDEYDVPEVNTMGSSEEKFLTETFYSIKIKMNHTELKEDFDINIVSSIKSNKNIEATDKFGEVNSKETLTSSPQALFVEKIYLFDFIDDFINDSTSKISNKIIGEFRLMQNNNNVTDEDLKNLDLYAKTENLTINSLIVSTHNYNTLISNSNLASFLNKNSIKELIISDMLFYYSGGYSHLDTINVELDLSNIEKIIVKKRNSYLNCAFLNNKKSNSSINVLDLREVDDSVYIYGKFQDLKIKKLYITTDLYNKDIFKNCEVDELIITKGTSDTLNNITDGAFKKIKKLTLEDGIKIIGEKAFDNYGIEKVAFSPSIEYLKAFAFANNEIKELNFKGIDRLRSFQKNVFEDNKIEKIICGNSYSMMFALNSGLSCS